MVVARIESRVYVEVVGVVKFTCAGEGDTTVDPDFVVGEGSKCECAIREVF